MRACPSFCIPQLHISPNFLNYLKAAAELSAEKSGELKEKDLKEKAVQIVRKIEEVTVPPPDMGDRNAVYFVAG